MLNIRLPAEIRAYKSKLVWGLSVRQILSIVAALVICIPVGVLGRKYISSDILPWIIMLLAAPCVAVGFLKVHDLPFEQYFKYVLKRYTTPQKRVYQDTETNLFCQIYTEILEESIIQQRIDAGEYESEEVQLWDS